MGVPCFGFSECWHAGMSPAEPTRVASGAPDTHVEGWGKWAYFAFRKEQGAVTVITGLLQLRAAIRGCGEDRLFSEPHSDMTTRQQMQVVTWENFTRCRKKEKEKEKFTMTVVKHWSRGPGEAVSFLGGMQSLTRQGPELTHLAGLVLSTRLDQMMSQRSPPTWTVLWFCDIATNSLLSIDRISQYYSVRAIYKAFCHRSICLHTMD